MKAKIGRALGICMLVGCALLCVACGQAQEADKTTSEGVDTPIQVSYAQYSGSHGSLFLAEGDSVAVISPSALPSQKQVDATVEGLKQWGYNPVQGKHVCEENRTLDDCIEDLTWALEDPSIKAIFCVRGGYGVSEVMDAIPLDLIASSDKLIIGYSDITACHSAWTAAGLPSVYGSMSATFIDLPKECAEAEKRMLGGEMPVYTCEANGLCIQGEADGVLIGGNLSTFTGVLGTAYDCTKIDEPYILFVEDVEEDIQHVHRYLTILDHLGVLDNAAGIVIGEWTDLPPIDDGDFSGDSRGGEFASVNEMIVREFADDLKAPVAFGFPTGHGEINYPLLLGERVHLSVSDGSYTLDWSQG
ncbi:MAG: LD-carboxypeptidase [Eggerthellaceae bacterium]|nr:LD-carboxypeptidase [Eggerthellaceae bacterium]